MKNYLVVFIKCYSNMLIGMKYHPKFTDFGISMYDSEKSRGFNDFLKDYLLNKLEIKI